jgi:hypothetical protein
VASDGHTIQYNTIQQNDLRRHNSLKARQRRGLLYTWLVKSKVIHTYAYFTDVCIPVEANAGRAKLRCARHGDLSVSPTRQRHLAVVASAYNIYVSEGLMAAFGT